MPMIETPYPAARKRDPAAKKANGSRFTIGPLKVTDINPQTGATYIKVPCPLCGEWPSDTNNNRHYKTAHQTTAKEVLSQPEHWAKAMEMAAAERERIAQENGVK